VDRGSLEVWAGLGFGGQMLLVAPSEDLVVVAMAWNVFGERVGNMQGALLDAIVASTRGR
jgi:hypothetical protein